jgi:hypothetical protein
MRRGAVCPAQYGQGTPRVYTDTTLPRVPAALARGNRRLEAVSELSSPDTYS